LRGRPHLVFQRLQNDFWCRQGLSCLERHRSFHPRPRHLPALLPAVNFRKTVNSLPGSYNALPG
jgi:hypothetical protein